MDKLIKRLAVFDFDGTLVSFDGLKLILILLAISSPVWSVIILFSYYFRLREKQRSLSEFAIPLLVQGRSVNTIKVLLNPYVVLCKLKINKLVWAEMERLRLEGFDIIIATASPSFAVSRILSNDHLLGFDCLVCKGRFTGKVRDRQPYGIEKMNQIKKYCDTTGFLLDRAYSDSIVDAPLLDSAKESYLVTKDGRMIKWLNDEVKSNNIV